MNEYEATQICKDPDNKRWRWLDYRDAMAYWIFAERRADGRTKIGKERKTLARKNMNALRSYVK